jgi:DNA adenine methylase
MTDALQSPYPYFGGKRRAASLVWRALGNCPNYVEPCFGSGAVLLARPHEPKIETINDLDCAIPNFWRAVQMDPDAVARWCDWPVSEVDLHARHRWLVERKATLRDAMIADPNFYDPQFAGWWVWGISMWIGSGWCKDARAVKRNGGYTRGFGRGIRGAAPERGPTQQLPSLNGGGRGISAPTSPPCQEWFRALSDRLRRVRVICGDWSRVVTDSVIGTTKSRNSGMNPCGIFLDPPYLGDRTPDLYSSDDMELATKMAAWAREKGDDRDVRIVLAGYEGDYDMPATWNVVEWKALRGYGNADNGNRHRERLWLSPHCLPVEGDDAQGSLFGKAAS